MGGGWERSRQRMPTVALLLVAERSCGAGGGAFRALAQPQFQRQEDSTASGLAVLFGAKAHAWTPPSTSQWQ